MSESTAAAPRISVAMAVYNNAPYLAAAIESILAQSYRDFEFLIVNDGSTDGSAAIIDQFAARDARIRPIHQENRGLIASLNRMLDEARGEYIARMDGDDISLPDRFETQVAFLDAHADHGAIGTSTNDMNEDGTLRPIQDYHPLSHDAFVEQLERGPWLCHPSVMMRRDVVRAAGGYRAAYRHCEDYDLWLRLVERTKLCTIPERLLLYRRSDSQVSIVHGYEQALNAAIAFAAHEERAAGRPDPTATLDRLPPLEGLDALFGRAGMARKVRARVVPNIVYSERFLRGGRIEIFVDYLAEGGDRGMLWRTVVRLLTLGEIKRGWQLARALITH